MILHRTLLLAAVVTLPFSAATPSNAGAPSPAAMAPASLQSTSASIRFRGEIGEVVEQVRSFRPDMSAFLTGDETALPKAKEQLADFRAQMDQLLTDDFIRRANNMGDRKTMRVAQRAERHAESIANRIGSINLDRMKSQSREGVMLGQYADMLFAGEILRQYARIYPQSEKIAAANRSVAERVADLGSFDAVEGRVAANQSALAAKRRLRPARQNNPALARDFQRAFRSSVWTQKDYAGAQILKTNLIETGWTVERNAITGIIISRYQRAHLGLKTTDGKCHSFLVIFEQKHAGGGRYGRTYMQSGQDAEMLCENI